MLTAVYTSPVNRGILYFSCCVLHVPNAALIAASVLVSAALPWPQVLPGGLRQPSHHICHEDILDDAIVALCGYPHPVSGTGWVNWIIILNGLLSLTGIIIPITKLLPVLFKLGQILPVTHGLNGLIDRFFLCFMIIIIILLIFYRLDIFLDLSLIDLILMIF